MRLRDGVSPEILCRQHLLGEHNEYHKILEPAITKNKPLHQYQEVLAVSSISYHRHDEIAKEMLVRGYNHRSPVKIEWRDWDIYKFNLDKKLLYPTISHSRKNLTMLIQGYITKNGKYKKACKHCQERYIRFLKKERL